MFARIIVVLHIALLVSCDWVDSTGVQSDSEPAPAILLEEGKVVSLVEQSARELDPSEALQATDSKQNFVWGDEPLQQGNLPGCENVEGFADEVAASSLQEACFEKSECKLHFQPQTVVDAKGERTVFNLTPPVIRAPVGLTYQLTASDAGGVTSEANFTFCLIAENESPIATDDNYPVVEGTSLNVRADTPGLLGNDTDDTESDVRNQPLYVLTPAASPPTLAESFELFADGSFDYTPLQSIDIPIGGTTDVFEYQISDGSYIVTAKVFINIVAQDKPPVLQQPIPASQAIVGIAQSISLSEYFSDPEGGALSFLIDPGSLPPSGNFILGATGMLEGVATAQDVGVWEVNVTATDATGQQISSSFALTVVANAPPTSLPIPAQSTDIAELFQFDTSSFFTDPEGVALNYTLAGAEGQEIAIDKLSGIISGFFKVAGVYPLTVTVTDGVNLPVSRIVRVTVTRQVNRAPVYSGSIANQTVKVGVAMKPIQGNFTDPDGDVLTYSILGSLPSGVTLSAKTGVIEGTPKRAGSFPNRRLVATDPAGLKVVSDPFTLTVVASTPNRAPVYKGQIPNQTIALGSAIDPIQGVFSDPDGDLLSYSIVGALPVGLRLSADGVLTGIPAAVGLSPNLRIRATDPAGLSIVSDIFRIRVTAAPSAPVNQNPVYVGSIDNQNIKFNVRITPISGNFSDPDGDILTYSLVNELPRGLRFSRTAGIISGIPLQTGLFDGIQITATDPGGLSVTSDPFGLYITR